jgi:hypothetical protein
VNEPPERLRLLLISSEWPPAGRAVRQQAESLSAAGCSVEVFAFQGGGNPYNFAAAWSRLRPRLHRGRYDVAHARSATDALLAFPKRVPLVVSLGGRPAGLTQFWARLVTWRADAVIVGTDDARQCVHARVPIHVIGPELDERARAARLVEVYWSVARS